MSLINYIVYESTTGQVLWTGTCVPDDLSLQAAAPNSTVLALAEIDPMTEYINTATEEVISRPAMPTSINKTSITSDGLDEVVVSGVPVGTVVTVTDPQGVKTFITVDDGSFEMTTTDFGDFTLLLNLFPYIDQEYSFGAIRP